MRIYSLLLCSQNHCLFISIPYPNQAYDKQRKNHFSVVICVCVLHNVLKCSEIVLFQDFFCTKKNLLVANHGGDP